VCADRNVLVADFEFSSSKRDESNEVAKRSTRAGLARRCAFTNDTTSHSVGVRRDTLKTKDDANGVWFMRLGDTAIWGRLAHFANRVRYAVNARNASGGGSTRPRAG
jgi:hypothetical protein